MSDYPLYDGRLPRVDEETSGEAADSHKDKGASLRLLILRYVDSLGAAGATCDEVEVHFGLRHQTASARLCELRQLGMVERPGTTRPTRSERKAKVHVAAGRLKPRQLEFGG